MLRFRRVKTLKKIRFRSRRGHNHFDAERHLIDSQTCKQRLAAALA